MCDVCAEFLDLLQSYEERINKESDERPLLKKNEVETVFIYIQSWSQRQCMCCFRDFKNFERFHLITQSIICLTVCQLKDLPDDLLKLKAEEEERRSSADRKADDIINKVASDISDDKASDEDKGLSCKDSDVSSSKQEDKEKTEKSDENGNKQNESEVTDSNDNAADSSSSSAQDEEKEESWSLQDKEKLLHFLSKVFLLNFPLYVAYKHGMHSKLGDYTQQEASILNVFCDLHDPEIPTYLLRNVSLFCKSGGVHAMTQCFDHQKPETLPVSIAHAIIAVVCNLKLWLNFRAIMQLFVPLRSKVLRYMCSLSDKDLRTPGIKTMADFMWSAIKDPLDSPLTFDRDGLDLAFKYFTSSTLTMRLAGIAQINSNINMFNELCNNESIVEIENVGQNLANWLIENQIISHIFGPNLHVEVIKQSHVILSFLAMECKITNSHIDTIWQAAQLKHCSKQVHDLLPPLIKNLEAGPVLHLYNLLCKLEPRDHTEQSLFLASALIKFIWTSGGTYGQMATRDDTPPFLGMSKAALMSLKERHHDVSSSENSISMEVSNSEDEQIEHGEIHKTASSDISEGPSPCKQLKRTKKKIPCHVQDSSDESIKVEDIEDEVEDDEEEEDEEVDEEDEDEEEDDDEEEEGLLFRHGISKNRPMHIAAKGLHHCNKAYMNRIASCMKRVGHIKHPNKKISNVAVANRFHHKDHSSTENDSEEERAIIEENLLKMKLKRKNMLRKKKMMKKCLRGKGPIKKIKKRPIVTECSDDDDEDEDEDEEEDEDIDDEDDEDDDEDEELEHSASEDEKPKARMESCIPKEKVKIDKAKDGIDGFEPDQEVPNVMVKEGSADFTHMEDHSRDSSHESVHAGVMTELASLVQGSPHDCRPFMKNLQAQRWFINAAFRNELLRSGDCTPEKNPRGRGEIIDDLSGDDGSCSSRMSNKSEKNMADFDGEESGCEDELVQLASQSRLNPHGLPPHLNMFHSRFHPNKISRLGSQFKIDNVCKPGNTLLWDLLQDDKIVQLGEGLALEAEKALCNLLCYNTERLIRIKFIEGCLDNLANNRSVVISLKLLPKLFNSFQQFRGMDTHQITTWAEHEHCMMECFFDNLKVYSEKKSGLSLYSHLSEIQVRLNFLSAVFSPIGSPECFRLSVDQVDTLWSCLATDPQGSDELFNWLLSQTKNKDQHALGMDTLKHLYLKKLPALEPETISTTALTLFQQLCTLARIATAHPDNPFRDLDVVGMDYLWKIALRANNTDVSMAAIQYLNSYYIGRQLDRESEFVSQCMSHIAVASENLASCEESSLVCIHRALLLLKTHLETFKKRYAYHLRRWALEGRALGSHVQLISSDKGCISIKVMIQPAGAPEKTTLEMQSSDYVADLRAEVAKWWEGLQTKNCPIAEKNSTTPVLGSLLSDGPIRMITGGQELTTEFDEKTLHEMGFKETQLVFISMGACRQQKKRDPSDTPSVLPPPPQESIPTLLLLQPHYFEQLFQLMQTLSLMKTPVKGGHHIPHTKAQMLSRRVWEILTLLPTNPTHLKFFQELGKSEDNISLQKLLDPASPQKLMYSLYIVESLSKTTTVKNVKENGTTGKASEKEQENNVSKNVSWSSIFVQHGGLRHIFDIFMSGVLQRDGSEWQQDCLACLLKLLCHLGMNSEDSDSVYLDTSDNLRNKHAKKFCKGNSDKVSIPKLNEVMMQMMKVDAVMPRLTSILQEASLPRDPNHYNTGFWGRAQVVHYAMALLVSWAYSCEEVREALFSVPEYTSWLQRLVLEDPEPAVRREVCTALYKLCSGTCDLSASNSIVPHMLSRLLEYLSIAESMRPQKLEALHGVAEDGKEPYGPACRDYFWLLCQLIENLPEEIIKESLEDPQSCVIDINDLAKRLAQSILSREYLETRHNTVDDDGLIGLLNLMCNVLKLNPPYKCSKEGQEFLLQVFEFLFALPNPRKRHVPKCKSQLSRSSAYDLLVELVKGAPESYHVLHEKLLEQQKPGPHSPYPWDYWPHEDGRSDCGYVGLTNLGATCYMASCMQHLYMMPQARTSILRAKCDSDSKHEMTLKELQRMFAYLLESERKAYNPRSFCKVYTMDHQPLNTGEQKDMAEFFIDLVSKLEEMTPELKKLVKTLFGGVLSNNVVSLDCDHVSRTLEEFYTVRCQVADMRNLYESLDEVTVKDTLEGDNMYTCSQCGKKVRAEKRACFKKLPHILCFNTMRYTFNMVTMLKEKVNTHFSFPLRLDMSGYVEKHLMPQRYQEEKRKSQLRKSEVKKDDTKEDSEQSCENTSQEMEEDSHENSDSEDFNECYQYDLIGVTVHTGTADGGHYYSFIRDRTTSNKDKWFLFNDAEVKPFDPNQIAAECFGGEMTSKTYDSVTDKFMDFSFEKTNSAYMLFYEWCSPDGEQRGSKDEAESEPMSSKQSPATNTAFELSKELEDWIWKDNMHFLRDKNIFEHTYFNFMWQICGYIPQTLLSVEPDITVVAAQLSTSFFMETFIHSKEKPTMVQWVELLTKQFNASQAACEWFLDHMAQNEWWPVQVLIKCPNQMVRQMFQRLCIHVIQRLRQSHAPLYLKADSDEEDDDEPSSNDSEALGSRSCVTRFIKMLLCLMEHGAKAHLKYLTEYFAFLHEFSKMGEEESQFLINVEAISLMVNFYLGQKAQDYVEVVSDDEDEEDIIPLPTDKYKPASLDKMITLIASLVEKSRGPEHVLKLSTTDFGALAGGKGFPFLYQQIKDNINLNQTRNLIFSLCRWNDRLAVVLVAMIFQAITKHSEVCQPFFKLLTLLTEANSSPGLPCFTQLILSRIWEVADFCPQNTLDWLAIQVPRNKLAHTWVLQSMDTWVEHFLLGHNNTRVRASAAYLLVSLIPSQHFRQGYRSARSLSSPHKELLVPSEAQMILHQVYSLLLRLLKPARHYTDIQTHGTMKLTSYFALLTYCVISRTEKLMFGQYFLDLWQLFHPKLSEPSVPVHHNKQALLLFWYHVCNDCPENIQLILQNAHVTKNIAFNYILADHEDQDVVMFNRGMLPSYYGLLRLCCQQSRSFTRQLASHQNLMWALKNITSNPTQYSGAVDELFKLIQLFVMKYPDSTEQEIIDINSFKKSTLQLYMSALDGRQSWTTFIMVFRTLVENDEDRDYAMNSGGMQVAFEGVNALHMMYQEASTMHVSGDFLEFLSIVADSLKAVRSRRDAKEARTLIIGVKEWPEVVRKLTTLLNTYNPPEMRTLTIDVLKEMVMIIPAEVIHILVPLLTHCHVAFQETHNALPMGPFYPRRGQKIPPVTLKTTSRPARPIIQMAIPHGQLESSKGTDPDYDQALHDFYSPYHEFIDVMCRLAINHECMSEGLVNLSAILGFEGVPLHFTFFPKLWLDIHHAQHVDRKFISVLTSSNYFVDYVEAVLLDERTSLNIVYIFNFLNAYFPKASQHVLTEQTCQLIQGLVTSLSEVVKTANVQTAAFKLNGDLKALCLVYGSETPLVPPEELVTILNMLLTKTKKILSDLPGGDSSGEETPPKKRKVTEEKPPEKAETTTVQPQPGSSKDSQDVPLSQQSSEQAESFPLKKQDDKFWVEILEKTVIDLISIIEKRKPK